METSLVINFQFTDKNKQKVICDALMNYSHGNIEAFTKAINEISGNNAVKYFSNLTNFPKPENITEQTKAGNTIVYFLFGSTGALENGNELRSLLIDLGVSKFSGYLETDFGEKHNLLKHPEPKRRKQSKSPVDIDEHLLNSPSQVKSLNGKNVVLTGEFWEGDHAVIREMVEKYGAKVQKSLVNDADVMLAGDNPGFSKIRKAAELGIPVLDQFDLQSIMAEENED
ncbi:MAG: hypothetical protein KZQ82_13550 [Candidatus Thiodiazotropha sp. (ex Lucinoma annulata)]|nr:hypothetical protein [Candidatus Thiodiazotropha sp. (ex Lucinoma annulata)]